MVPDPHSRVVHLIQPRAGFIMAILSPDDPKAIIPADRDVAFEGFVNSQVSIVWSSPRFFEVRQHT